MVRIAFGLAWAADAALKWLPGFADRSFMATLQNARSGQLDVVRTWITFWIDIFSSDPRMWAYALGAVESIIAICLILGGFTNAICALGGLLSLGIWTTAEGFGGPYTSGSTDISASIIYVMVFALLALAAAGGVWGADRWLRPRAGRLSWLCASAAGAPRGDAASPVPPAGRRRPRLRRP